MLRRTQNANNAGLSGPETGTRLFTGFSQKSGNATNATDERRVIRFGPTTQAGTPVVRVLNSAREGMFRKKWKPVSRKIMPKHYGLIATMPSISTDIPFGSEPMPTAERA